ncbi:MAG: prolyl oligopeptidase family serine peptidase [Isosphaeraceae bacterium]|nr:prolyl oligopeptidase family serine peptidase [Isosphaeraceae bacterium]
MPRSHLLTALVLAAGLVPTARGEGNVEFTRKEDVVYGRKFGTALTLDVLTPKAKPNGKAVILVVSGGWFSSHEGIPVDYAKVFLSRGYTVFAVVHGSQPRFAITDVLSDMNRAVRFIRYHAHDYGIDPDQIGITGGSAGGHLSLMQGAAGDAGDPNAKDPIDRVSSRVQAVACFYPPTDFLNYGKPGENAVGRGILAGFKAPFDFQELDPKTNTFVRITDEPRILELGRKISPANHASADDPPILIIHGDADKLVPIQQAEVMVARLKENGVPAKLVVKPGAAHGWPDLLKDVETFADWFDEYLKPRAGAK